MENDKLKVKLAKLLEEYGWKYDGKFPLSEYNFGFLWNISDTTVLKAKKGILRKRYILLKDLFIPESQKHEMYVILCKKITGNKYICHTWMKIFEKVSEAIQEVNEILAKL